MGFSPRKYKNSKLISVDVEGGIIFVSLEHNLTKIVFSTFLGEHLLGIPIYLNKDLINQELEKLHVVAKQKNKIFMEKTIFLQIQQDLIKIFKEYTI